MRCISYEMRLALELSLVSSSRFSVPRDRILVARRKGEQASLLTTLVSFRE